MVREIKPEIVFEISPNSGYSTNYLLAAVTRNGFGRVDSFELLQSFNGVSTADTIRGSMVALCDPARHNLILGDARVEALRRLDHGIPGFTLLDSCHDDFFAEFYVKALLPRLAGAVVVQDILHFDPRPEWSTEAQYVLSWLYETGTPFLPLSLYEDLLQTSAVRARLTPRRPMRNSSILMTLGTAPAGGREASDRLLALIEAERAGKPAMLDPLFPLNSTLSAQHLRREFRDRTAPADRYVAAGYGRAIDEDAPGYCDIMAFCMGSLPLTGRLARSVVRLFDSFDPFLQVYALECLVLGEQSGAYADLCRRVVPEAVRGVELTHRMAFVAARLNLREEAIMWIRACRAAGMDHSLPVGFRALLQCARLAETLKAEALAQGLLDDVLAIRAFRLRTGGGAEKIDREIAAFCQQNPRLASLAKLV